MPLQLDQVGRPDSACQVCSPGSLFSWDSAIVDMASGEDGKPLLGQGFLAVDDSGCLVTPLRSWHACIKRDTWVLVAVEGESYSDDAVVISLG